MTLPDPFGLTRSVVDGRYRVERVVGQGGFGVVYRAQHLGFDAPVALKVLRLPEDWSNERRETRIAAFQREGRMLFELSQLHPSVVRAHETGSVRTRDGSLAPYLALEWLDGVAFDVELKARRARALPPLSLPEALRLLHAVAEGLTRAHAGGVAHRDIKPGNLFIVTRGGEQHVKILDFGVAKLVDGEMETTERFTRTLGGASSFTPLYAAPEQWLERLGATGAWTDVHALALVLVELISGRSPFLGRDSRQLMAACLDPLRPTPRACGAEVDAEVEAVFARALAIEPRERFADAGAFWKGLLQAANWQPREHETALLELVAQPVYGAVDAASEKTPTATAPLAPTGTTAPSVSLARITRATAAQGSKAALGALSIGAVGLVAYGLGARATRAVVTPHRVRPAPTAVVGTNPAPMTTVAALVSKLAEPSLAPAASPHAPPVDTRGAGHAPVTRRRPSGVSNAVSTSTASAVAASAPSITQATPSAGRRLAPVNVDDPALLRRK